MPNYPLVELRDAASVRQFGYKTKLGAGMTEDEIKAAIKFALEGRSYEVTVTWGKAHGTDIVACLGSEKILIEVKSEGNTRQQLGNYFPAILGQILTRMDDDSAGYGIALPAHASFIELILKLPRRVRERLRLDFYVVKPTGTTYEVGLFSWLSG